MSGTFKEIRNTLDSIMKERIAEGVQEKTSIEEHEEILWQKTILGEDSPDKRRNIVFDCFKLA